MSGAATKAYLDVQSDHDSLNSLKSQIEDLQKKFKGPIFTSQDDIDNYESLVEEYNNLAGTWDDKLETYETLSKLNTNVVSHEIPNFKDENQWRAGGLLHNEKYPGGFLYNPTVVLGPEERLNKDDISHMINGSFTSWLNPAFTQIQSDIKGFDFLDLFVEARETKIVSYEITVKINQNGKESSKTHIVITSQDGETGSFDFGQHQEYADMSTAEMAEAVKAPGINLMSPDLKTAFVSVAIKNVLSGEFFESPKMSVRDFAISSLNKTIQSMLSTQMTSFAAKALGLKSMYAVGILNIAIGMVVGELAEMAMGLDNHFGFGGEYSGTLGTNFYSEKKGFIEGIKESIGGLFGNEYSNMATTYSGETLGQLNANYAEMTTSTFGEFSRLSRNIDNYNNIGNTIDSFAKEVSTFGSFKSLEKELGLNSSYAGGGNNIGGGNFGSSNNPGGGVGASGRGPGGVGGFGGGM